MTCQNHNRGCKRYSNDGTRQKGLQQQLNVSGMHEDQIVIAYLLYIMECLNDISIIHQSNCNLSYYTRYIVVNRVICVYLIKKTTLNMNYAMLTKMLTIISNLKVDFPNQH